MKYENILQTIGDPPVIKINRLAPEHVDLYVKMESFNPMASVKDRLAFARAVIRSGAATCVDNILIARFIDVDAARLRANVARYWIDLRSELGGLPPVLPRVWET